MQNSYLPEGYLFGTAENTEYIKNEASLYSASQSGKILEAMAVSCSKQLDLHVLLNGMRGVIVRDEAVYTEGGPVKDIAVITRVGTPVCFKVRDVAPVHGERVAILSRADAQRECSESFLSKLLPGDVIGCRVTHTEQFGAFADVGCGIPALLPVDRISVSRLTDASDRVKKGDRLRCVVCRTDGSPLRMFLSLREMLGTWEENAALFSAGQTVSGTVRGVEPYGIFIELMPNLSGLSEYRDDVSPGDRVAVYIKSIDPGKMKVKLVIVEKHGKSQPSQLQYFVPDNVTHIYKFIYSTPNSSKIIETDFC